MIAVNMQHDLAHSDANTTLLYYKQHRPIRTPSSHCRKTLFIQLPAGLRSVYNRHILLEDGSANPDYQLANTLGLVSHLSLPGRRETYWNLLANHNYEGGQKKRNVGRPARAFAKVAQVYSLGQHLSQRLVAKTLRH